MKACFQFNNILYVHFKEFLCEFNRPIVEKIVAFLVKTVRSLVRVIANDKVLLKN